MPKIVSNYSVLPEETDVLEQLKQKSLDPIVKKPIVDEEEKVIEHIDPEPPPPPAPTEPTLKVMRNHEGVVVGVEVNCICGEKIMIKMDYK